MASPAGLWILLAALQLACGFALTRFAPPLCFAWELGGCYDVSERRDARLCRELIAHEGASAAAGARPASAPGEAAVLPDPAAQRLQYIANLLALVLPPQSIGLAFRALLTGDPKLRAIAIEYLDSVLPESLRDQIAAQFELPAARPAPTGEEALLQLIDAKPSILAKLKEMGVKEERDI